MKMRRLDAQPRFKSYLKSLGPQNRKFSNYVLKKFVCVLLVIKVNTLV